MKRWLCDNWLYIAALVFGILFAAAFASFTAQAAGPVEPPAPIRVPYTELRSAYPDMPLGEFFRMVRPWEVMAAQINDKNRFIFEAIRNPLIQDTIGFLHTSDSLLVIWPKPFRDTNYTAHFTVIRYRNGIPGLYTGSGFSMRKVWPESCYVNTNNNDDSGYVMITGVGLRK